MDKIGRNDPCPCGSGKKYKRCCLLQKESASGFADVDRRSALDGLERFAGEKLEAADEVASTFFYQEYELRLDELDDQWIQVSEEVYDMWFFCDWQLENGRSVVDLFIERNPDLGAGERRYLRLLRETSMRLYEVEDLSPGQSLTLREIPDGMKVTVRERLGSRSLWRHALIAARIISRGPSGGPEIERGLLSIPELIREPVVSQFIAYHQEFQKNNPAAGETEFYKGACPFIHEAWLSSLLDPKIPKLANTDGEDLLLTRVQFDIVDPAALESALDKAQELDREEERKPAWIWSGTNRKGNDIVFGRLVLKGKKLELECNSIARAERGRAFIESFVPDGIRHRATVHENTVAAIRDQIRSQVTAGGSAARQPDGFPPELQEALTLDAYARHYRRWLDEPIPALSEHTPREAARDSNLRPQLVDLIRGLEGRYQLSLKERTPAYDPSWMWAELGLVENSIPAHPPPLANERMEIIVPGFGELCRRVADQVRRRPGFEDASTIVTAEEIKTNIEIVRFLSSFRCDTGPESQPSKYKMDASSLERHIPFVTNFELHLRKTFCVDESLAYMLAKTDLGVLGSELRMPFPCFALVFTDRYSLSMAERKLSAEPNCPIAGHFLKVATVYVTEERLASNRILHLGFALDALGADPPHLIEQDVVLIENQPVRQYLDSLFPKNVSSLQTYDLHPLRRLLHLIFNAILYATSAEVEPRSRRSPGRTSEGRSGPKKEPLIFSSENVYFLPGAIEISRVRNFQELERVSDGRSILHRFMVRGHWRRAAASWKDQRMRWIEPYWKGPDIAAVIERTYKLMP